MEHIPHVRGSKLGVARLTVPYLSKEWEYGSTLQGADSFAAFPAKHGFRSQLNDQESASQDKKDDNGTAPSIEFLQAWLYFGLLAETFGTPEMCFDYKDFIRQADTEDGNGNGESSVITTKHLTRYIWYWTAATAHGHRYDYDDHCENLDKCLEIANKALNAFSRDYYSPLSPSGGEKKEKQDSDGWSTTTTILFSIISLSDYLRRARIDINGYAFEASLPALEWDFPPLNEALREAGWCDGEIAKLERTTDCSTRFYLAQIDRWSMGNDHSKCSRLKGCLAHQIDESTYKTRHRPDCKSAMCWNMGPNAEDIVKILDEGGYPLVQLGDDSRSVHIKPANKTGKYVTISHVWSDGLGNPHTNTLPHCQVVYIQGLVNALYPESEHPVPIWNDTLCIPVDPKYLAFRRLAINRMNKTFRSSHKTLALDNSLMAQSTDDDDWVEMNMRIKYCPWVSRAWTLLEGRVGRTLLFQFKDKAVSSSVVFNPSSATRNVNTVSNMLLERGIDTVLSEPNALRLARALTLLPQEPGQDADADENADADSETLLAARVAYTTWHPILQSKNQLSNITDLDDDMRVVIERLRIFCPVTKHSSVGTRDIRDEFWLETIEADYTGPTYESHSYFEGVVNAFRGRTTSKLEDETLCFGQMLGIDTSALAAVRPLTARARYWYTLLDENPFLKTLAGMLGVDTRARLLECQERRVQVLLLQVGKLPLSMVLWDTPRMRANGWKWAPSSLLGAAPSANASSGWASNERGTVTSDGFHVVLHSLKLQAATSSTSGADLKVSLYEAVYLVVSTTDPRFGAGSATIKLSMPRDDLESSPWRKFRTWRDLVQAGTLDRLLILTRRRASVYDPFQKRGILVEARENMAESDTHIADFRAVVDKPHEHEIEQGLPTVLADGVWDVESRTTWCVA